MGGNALPNVSRIKREFIDPTLKFVGSKLSYLGIDYNYLKNHLMGSAGKQTDSGDLDIAIDKNKFNRQTLVKIGEFVRKEYGDKFVNSKGLNSGQINTSWPIVGDDKFIQIDFIIGDVDWLKFSHYSPGKDISPYKGVWISTILAVLAKFAKDYELIIDPISGKIIQRKSDIIWTPEEGDRIARVGLSYDLEKGLHRVWKMQKKQGQHVSKVSPDEWESTVKLPQDQKIPPRFTRTGYITNPPDVLRILFKQEIDLKQVDTFEKIWKLIKKMSSENKLPNIDVIKDRFADALISSSSGKEFKNKEQVLQDPIFK